MPSRVRQSSAASSTTSFRLRGERRLSSPSGWSSRLSAACCSDQRPGHAVPAGREGRSSRESRRRGAEGGRASGVRHRGRRPSRRGIRSMCCTSRSAPASSRCAQVPRRRGRAGSATSAATLPGLSRHRRSTAVDACGIDSRLDDAARAATGLVDGSACHRRASSRRICGGSAGQTRVDLPCARRRAEDELRPRPPSFEEAEVVRQQRWVGRDLRPTCEQPSRSAAPYGVRVR